MQRSPLALRFLRAGLLALAMTSPTFHLVAQASPENRDVAAARRVGPRLRQAYAEIGLTWGAPVFLRLFKESNELEIWVESKTGGEFELFRAYKIAYYSGSLGPKLREGDLQAPEGFYAFGQKQLNPQSRFHLSFNIGYPNAYDKHHGRTGGLIMVHGNVVSIGCFAMTDALIEEIYTIVRASLAKGQGFIRVHSFPFRMTEQRMAKAVADGSSWIEFWRNLKEGYDAFEARKRPPSCVIKDGRYAFD